MERHQPIKWNLVITPGSCDFLGTPRSVDAKPQKILKFNLNPQVYSNSSQVSPKSNLKDNKIDTPGTQSKKYKNNFENTPKSDFKDDEIYSEATPKLNLRNFKQNCNSSQASFISHKRTNSDNIIRSSILDTKIEHKKFSLKLAEVSKIEETRLLLEKTLKFQNKIAEDFKKYQESYSNTDRSQPSLIINEISEFEQPLSKENELEPYIEVLNNISFTEEITKIQQDNQLLQQENFKLEKEIENAYNDSTIEIKSLENSLISILTQKSRKKDQLIDQLTNKVSNFQTKFEFFVTNFSEKVYSRLSQKNVKIENINFDIEKLRSLICKSKKL